MNKALLIGIPVIVIGGALWYYPQYQAPKAHEFIQTQLTQVQTNLRASDAGDLKIIKHETSTTGSQVEIEWSLKTSADLQAMNLPENITFFTSADIALNSLPSAKGFKTINSTTRSPDLDEALQKQGTEEGLTFACETKPTSSGLDTNCSTNEITLKNAQATTPNSIASIAFAASAVNFDIDEKNQNVTFGFELPHIKLNTDTNTASVVEQISMTGFGPYDLSQGTFKEHLSGFVSVDGKSTGNISIKKIQANPNGTEDEILIDGIQIESAANTEEGISEIDMKMKVGAITGVPEEIAGIEYSMQIKNFLNTAMAELNRVFDQSMSQPVGEPFGPEQIKQVRKFAIDMLAVGPVISQKFGIDQESGTVLSVTSNTAFKANTQEHITQAIEQISDTQASNPMALLPFVLENITLSLDADIKKELAEQIAILAAAARPQDPAMTEEEQQESAMQSIAMLEMMGIVKKTDTSYSSSFTLDDNGVMLNGQDMGPLLGLPPQ